MENRPVPEGDGKPRQEARGSAGEPGRQECGRVLIGKNEGSRRAVESALARELTARGAQGIPGYTLVPAEAVKDESKVKAGRSLSWNSSLR